MDPELDKIAQTLRPIEFPTRFAVEVCSACNLACTMCHHPAMLRPKGIMPFELWEKCARQIARISPQTECWFSFIGDPLLEPGLLLRMLGYGKSVGLCSLNVNTNGMLLTPEIAERLMDSGAHNIVVGIDGFSAAAYERIRVGGNRDILYSNVEHLLSVRRKRSNGPVVLVQFIEMDENAGEIDAFQRHWLERGAVVKLRNKLSWGGRFETLVQVDPQSRIPCPWAVTMMHVFWDGRVPRCPGDTEGDEGVGNAWQEPLDVLWGRLGKFRRLHLSHRFADLPERCHTCQDWATGAAKKIQPVV